MSTRRAYAPRDPIVRTCLSCGGIASWGYGVFVRKGLTGDWYCSEHRPEIVGAVQGGRRPIGRQGELL